MPVKLNHTIVWSRDPEAGARFLAEILNLAPPTPFGPFHVVTVDNGVSLAFMANQGADPAMQPYACDVGETEFDAIRTEGSPVGQACVRKCRSRWSHSHPKQKQKNHLNTTNTHTHKQH